MCGILRIIMKKNIYSYAKNVYTYIWDITTHV